MNHIFGLGIFACCWTVVAAVAAEEKSDPAAEKMMYNAHAARATWGDDFPGFSATVIATAEGQTQRGNVTVSPEGKVTLEMPEGPVGKWAASQLESIVMHRLSSTRDQYDVSFADDDLNHPLGRLIKFHGGETHSLYRIKDDVITEVHRTIGKLKFTISVTKVARSKDGQTLPSHFNVSYWETESGALNANHDFDETWTRVGKFDLPQRRLSIRTAANERKVAELRLSDHKLLGATKKTGP